MQLPKQQRKKQRKNEEKENLAGNGDNEDNSDGNGGRLGAEQSPCMTRFLKNTFLEMGLLFKQTETEGNVESNYPEKNCEGC